MTVLVQIPVAELADSSAPAAGRSRRANTRRPVCAPAADQAKIAIPLPKALTSRNVLVAAAVNSPGDRRLLRPLLNRGYGISRTWVNDVLQAGDAISSFLVAIRIPAH
jgi:hypothetical protein